jgi:RNA-directed DNA polymerase
MGREQQQGRGRQRDLFDEARKGLRCHDDPGGGGTAARATEERQAPTAGDETRALPLQVMDEVASSANLNRAYKRVKANRGAPGVDGVTVFDLLPWIATNREALIASLLDGSYQPQPVRGVEIPKPGGGMRQLGIPTMVDRLVQQALLQVLEPILDPPDRTNAATSCRRSR